jgi:TrmH family RNA methyltransferase
MKTVSSPDNPLVKAIRRAQRRKGKRSKGLAVLEGVKLAREALGSGISIETAVVSKLFLETDEGKELAVRLEEAADEQVSMPAKLFRRMSTQEHPEGVLLLASMALQSLESLPGEPVLVVVGVQDPGNLGAMARVAEASGARALVKCEGSADPFQPKALRASMGSLLRLPVLEGGAAEATLSRLKAKGLTLAACTPRQGIDYREADLRSPLALVVGAESTGLPESLLEHFDLQLYVPMKEPVDSLNVAVTAGLVLYEAARQRGSV